MSKKSALHNRQTCHFLCWHDVKSFANQSRQLFVNNNYSFFILLILCPLQNFQFHHHYDEHLFNDSMLLTVICVVVAEMVLIQLLYSSSFFASKSYISFCCSNCFRNILYDFLWSYNLSFGRNIIFNLVCFLRLISYIYV